MRTPLYKEAFSHSWKIAWKKHQLWPLGLFAAALGQMGLVDYIMQSWATARGYQPGQGWGQLFELVRETLSSGLITGSMWGWVAFLTIVFVGFGVLFLFAAVISQGALVHDISQSIRKKKIDSFASSWHIGVAHGWRVFFVNVLKKLSLFLMGMIIAFFALPLLLSGSGSPALFLLAFVLASLFGIVVSLLAIYAIGYIVVEEYSFMRAIRSAWQLFVEHWLVSLEVGVVIFFLDIVVAFLVMAVLFLSLVPAFFAYLFGAMFSSGAIFVIGIAISATIFTILFFLIASVFSVFTTTTWMYLFMHMHKTGLKSHILHWLR